MAFRWGEGTLMERLEQWPGAASRLAQRRWCAKDVLPLEGSVGTAGKPSGLFVKCRQHPNSLHLQSAESFPTCCLIRFQNSLGSPAPGMSTVRPGVGFRALPATAGVVLTCGAEQ